MTAGTPGDAEVRRVARQAILDFVRMTVQGGSPEELQRALDIWNAVHGNWTDTIGVHDDGTLDVDRLPTVLMELITASSGLIVSLLRSVEGWSGAPVVEVLAGFERHLAARDEA